MKPAKALYEKRISEILMTKKVEQRIIRFFPNTDMRNGHPGLRQIALKQQIDVSKLSAGEYVLFMNSRRTAVKMFVPGNVIAHLKMPNDSRIDPRVIAHIPRFFNGKKIDYDQALEEMLRVELGKKN